MAIHSLEDLFVHELMDLYDAENQLVRVLPNLIQAANGPALKTALEEHLTQTQDHVTRLEAVFMGMGMKAKRQTCEAMQGILYEANELLSETTDSAVRDAALIAAVQRVEHYEMAGYGTARTYAYVLGYDHSATLLQETLDEEEQADKRLTQVANTVNAQAVV